MDQPLRSTTRRRGALLGGIVCSLIIAAPALSGQSEAHAQDAWARAQRSRVGFDMDVWPSQFFGDNNIVAHAFSVPGQIGVTDEIFITFDIPSGIVWYDLEDPFEDDVGAMFGNPSVGAYFAPELLDDKIVFVVGGQASIPTYFDPEGLVETLTPLYLSVVRAGFDMHRFLPETFSLQGRAGVEIRPIEWFTYRGDFEPIFLIDVDDDGASGTSFGEEGEFFIENGNDFEFKADIGVGGGVRLQHIIFASENDWGDENDNVQFAAMPYFVYEPPDLPGFYARAGLMVALDEPLGFGFDEGGVAALNSSFGGTWDP